MWRTVENSNNLRPDELEIDVDTVYVRKDFVLVVSDEEGKNEHWKYKEKQFSREAYENYLQAQELGELLG